MGTHRALGRFRQVCRSLAPGRWGRSSPPVCGGDQAHVGRVEVKGELFPRRQRLAVSRDAERVPNVHQALTVLVRPGHAERRVRLNRGRVVSAGGKHPGGTRTVEPDAETVFAWRRTPRRAHDRDRRISMFEGDRSEGDEGRRTAPSGERLRGARLRDRRPRQEEIREEAGHDSGSQSDDQDPREDCARALRRTQSRWTHDWTDRSDELLAQRTLATITKRVARGRGKSLGECDPIRRCEGIWPRCAFAMA